MVWVSVPGCGSFVVDRVEQGASHFCNVALKAGMERVAGPIVPTALPPSGACSCPEGHALRATSRSVAAAMRSAICMLQTAAWWERVRAARQICGVPVKMTLSLSQKEVQLCLHSNFTNCELVRTFTVPEKSETDN